MDWNEAFLSDSELTYYSRSLARGVRRSCNMPTCCIAGMQRKTSQDSNLYVQAAVMYAERASRPPRAPRLRVSFNFNALFDDDCQRNFRFDKAQIGILLEVMGLHDIVTCD